MFTKLHQNYSRHGILIENKTVNATVDIDKWINPKIAFLLA